MRPGVMALAAAAILAASWTEPVLAQTPRGYVAATVGSFRVSADSVEGNALAAGGAAGFAMLPWLDIEAEVLVPATGFTRSYGSENVLSVSYAPAGSTAAEIERLGVWLRYDHRRDVMANASAVAIFHVPVADARVSPGFILGVSTQRVRQRTDYTPLRVGPGIPPTDPRARPSAETGSRTLGGLTVGVNLAIAVTPHLAIVPDVRYDYGSIGDEINNALRSSIRLVVRF